LEMDVGVEALGYHFDFWWIDRIILTDLKLKPEPSILIWRVWWPFNKCLPLIQIIPYWTD